MTMSHTERVIALIDMDCFYCQVEEQLDPDLIGKPIAVVQYNQWKGGGIIAVNYIAREKGVTRQMRGDEAKEKCPGIQLPRVPQVRGKADLTKYREAGKRVAEVLLSFTNLLERASIDEAYLDLTEAVNTELKQGIPKICPSNLPNTYIVGCETTDFVTNINQNQIVCENDLKLAIGGVLIEKIRAEVLKKTGFKCSAGIAHNKTLAKLVCSLHKPNKQTILPQNAVAEMFSKLPVRKIKSLGGKFGYALSEKLNINCIGELVKFTEKELVQNFDEKSGRWLYNICRGIDNEPVQIKLIPKSIGCCKRFPGKGSLRKLEEVTHWINELSQEIAERLDEDLRENNRKGRLMTVGFSQETNQTEVSSTRAVHLKSYEVKKISQDALEVLQKNCQKSDGSFHVTFLGLTISNFENTKNLRSIDSFFKKRGSDYVEEKNQDENKSKEIDYVKPIPVDSTRLSKKYSIAKYFNSMDKSSDTTHETIEIDSSQVPVDYIDCNASSITSDSTISLNENPEDLIFYDESSLFATTKPVTNRSFEKSPEKNCAALPLLKSNSLTSVGSLEEELNGLSYSNSPILKAKTTGFFTRYFDERANTPPCGRNFDTSKNLDTDSSDEENPDTESDEQISKNCEECNLLIPIEEIPLHMDHHLALRLSKEASPVKNVRPISTSKSMKRGRTVDPPKNSILSFFKNEDVSANEPAVLCPDCNKRIKIIDVESHSDYHVAKKIHLEINNSNSATNPVNTTNSPGNSKKGRAGTRSDIDKSKKSIASFFRVH